MKQSLNFEQEQACEPVNKYIYWLPDRLEEINKTNDDSPSTSHNDNKWPLVLNLENLHDISSELSSQGQILSQVVQDIQLHHKVCIPCPVQPHMYLHTYYVITYNCRGVINVRQAIFRYVNPISTRGAYYAHWLCLPKKIPWLG